MKQVTVNGTTTGHATTVWELTRGLMFTKKSNLLMEFPREQIISLHNWFVFYPLHLAFFNDDMIVREVGYMKPFGFYTSKTQYKYCLELGTGTVQVGDTIKW